VSCIAGLFDRSGKPVDSRLVERMLVRMKGRAPDGSEVQCSGATGMGVAFLRTGSSPCEQPYKIAQDNQIWLAADARIDGRSDLVRRLRDSGARVEDDATHAELIVHAYHAWGEHFVEHLIGDFAFALWDQRAGKLICARDHFGVRPFYFFESGSLFGFASDIDALLSLPQVSHELDEISVADFLLFGIDQDPERTIYRDIRCLPAATRLEVSRAAPRQHTYWQLQRNGETRCRNPAEYVERFTAVFEQAVADRLPAGPVAFQLSGGMDSTAIAATATCRPDAATRPTMAYTVSAQTLVPEDDERAHAQAAAAHLGIPLLCQELGDYELFGRSAQASPRTSWPLSYPHLAAYRDALDAISKTGARVLLSGHGADSVMARSSSYYPDLLRNRSFTKLLKETGHHLRHARSLSGMGLLSVIRSRPPQGKAWSPPMPDWLDPDLAKRVSLEERWVRGWNTLNNAHDAHQQLTQPWFSRNLQAQEILDAPVVVRYPFLDLRLVEFALGLPNFMVGRKRILREAMRGKLPELITLRPKTSLRGDVVRVIVTRSNKPSADALRNRAAPEVDLDAFVRALDRYRAGEGAGSTWASLFMLNSMAWGHWQHGEKKG
jgi:asparagine synthase (glutamine-hydrolysing)